MFPGKAMCHSTVVRKPSPDQGKSEVKDCYLLRDTGKFLALIRK